MIRQIGDIEKFGTRQAIFESRELMSRPRSAKQILRGACAYRYPSSRRACEHIDIEVTHSIKHDYHLRIDAVPVIIPNEDLVRYQIDDNEKILLLESAIEACSCDDGGIDYCSGIRVMVSIYEDDATSDETIVQFAMDTLYDAYGE